MGKAMITSQILTVAAISAQWWSFSSLWNSLGAMQWAAVVSAAVLTFGAVIEYWEKLKKLILLTGKWIARRSTAFDRCIFRKLLIHSAGPILVVLGIAGEVIFEGRTFIIEDRQEEEARATTGSLRDQASNLSREENSLKLQLEAANKESKEINGRLDRASDDMGLLEKDIAAQGPRWRLLERNRPKLVKLFTPFALQRVRVFVCGRPGQPDEETLKTAMAVEAILGRNGAGWNVEYGNVALQGGVWFVDSGCQGHGSLGVGLGPTVNARISPAGMKAAKSLASAFDKMFPLADTGRTWAMDSAFIQMLVKRGLLPADDPMAIVANDPDLIAVVVGAHP